MCTTPGQAGRRKRRDRRREADRYGANPPSSDDFEVSIFLTETNTRHSLLYKHKHFRDTTQTKLTSNSSKLTGASRDAPIDLEDHAELAVPSAARRGGGEEDGTTPIRVLREEDDDEAVVPLHDIPAVGPGPDETNAKGLTSPPVMRPSKRRRGPSGPGQGDNRDGAGLGGRARSPPQGAGPSAYAYVVDSDDDDLFVSDDDDESEQGARPSALAVGDDEDDEDEDEDEYEEEGRTTPPPAKRRRKGASLAAEAGPEEAQRDDKKKLAMDISYEGFSIYGRVLCLVIKRRDGMAAGAKGKGKAVASTSSSSSAAAARGTRAGQSAAPGGQAVMENWITSTQVPADAIAE